MNVGALSPLNSRACSRGNRSRLAAIATFGLLFHHFQASGQQDEALERGDAANEVIDEIVVFGEKSMPQLRREVYRAEENFFEMFNALNDDDEFDVRCFYETPTGTKIRQHVCRAEFVSDAYGAELMLLKSLGPKYPIQDPALVVARKSKEFEKRLLELVFANPELQTALSRYRTARDNYKSEKLRRNPGASKVETSKE